MNGTVYYSNIEVIHAVCKSKLSAGIKGKVGIITKRRGGQSVDMTGQRYCKKNKMKSIEKVRGRRKSREYTKVQRTRNENRMDESGFKRLFFFSFLLHEEQLRLPKRIYIHLATIHSGVNRNKIMALIFFLSFFSFLRLNVV